MIIKKNQYKICENCQSCVSGEDLNIYEHYNYDHTKWNKYWDCPVCSETNFVRTIKENK